jgi:hypothetical protein
MIKPTAKTKAIRMPAKERPAASQLGIQRPPTTKPHLRNLSKNKKPSDSLPIGHAEEDLDHRFLRSQLRVLGPGSLSKARPWRSEYQLIMRSQPLNI